MMRIALRATVNAGRVFSRHWRRIVTATTVGIAVVRGVIWIAKAVASASTVDTALNLIGLGEYVRPYVRPFEDAVDGVVATVISVVLTVLPTG